MSTEQPAIRTGDTWVCVTARGRGRPVTVRRVTRTAVFVSPQGRGSDTSSQHKVPMDIFQVSYCPIKLAEDRQRTLRELERAGVTMPSTYNTRKAIATDASEDVIQRTIDEMVLPTTPSDLAPRLSIPEVPLPVRRNKTDRRFTDAQAIEVLELWFAGMPRKEIAEAYGVSGTTVTDLVHGRTYQHLPKKFREGVRVTPPNPGRKPDPCPPEIITVADPIPVVEEETQPVVTHKSDQRLEYSPQPKPAAKPVAIDRAADAVLLADMADAIEMLTQYAAPNLPKFVTIDTTALMNLVNHARSLSTAIMDSR